MSQATKIIRRSKDVESPMPFEYDPGKVIRGKLIFPEDTGWKLWIISDSEAYWIHTKTDKVVASSRNY